ncbi:MAG: ABC transporter ATP-binding protein [Alphaproteobacteria bacterium]|nr:ABC transporter ATP-binding protein [Alphaproteobacteria bacterium]
MLILEGVSVHYGKVVAIRDIDLEVREGEIVALIGANGAGKSTTLRAISGLEPIRTGRISFEGNRIDGVQPEEITRRGIAHIPEGRRIFPQMTVLENLEMGAYLRRDKAEMEKNLEDVFRHFKRLKERVTQLAGTMSGGEQQMLAMGRALMANPKLIVMDEPSLGLSRIMCQEIARIIRDVHAEGRTVVLVEQNARLALSLADRGYVLETGNVALHGPASELRGNDLVRKTYLGLSDD